MDCPFAALENELRNGSSTEAGELSLPRIAGETLEEKLETVRRLLKRSLELKCRISALVNAYYLGKLLNQAEGVSKKYKLKKKLTTHYAVMAEYTYDIFEPNPYQILQTSLIDVQKIKKLKRKQVLQLRSSIESNVYINFAGAQNLEEEIVTGDPTAE